MLKLLRKLLRKRSARVEHRTVDGGRLCPHPGMTDADLKNYEQTFSVPGYLFSYEEKKPDE